MDRTAFLEGEDVALRPVEEDDLPWLRDVVNNPDVWRWLGFVEPNSMEDERAFLDDLREGDRVGFLVTADGERAGLIDLRPGNRPDRSAEFGLMIDPRRHGEGIGTEAVRLAVDYGFDHLGLHRVWALTEERNEKMQRVFEKVGFEREGVQREQRYADGEFHDMVIYGMLEDEWDSEDR